MASLLRTTLHTFIPSHFHDPLGLTIRLIRSRDRAAWFAIETALLGLLLTPLDLLLQIAEKRRYRRAARPKRPLIFVCGAPRSGTTLVTQVLVAHLPVCYINNLTAVFPRSPVVANLLFGKGLRKPRPSYSSYYGKSTSFSGPNDALYIWDRWFGRDRTRAPSELSPSTRDRLVRFFGAYEEIFERPVLNKNNSLNTCADLVASALENSFFVCVRREPLYLAQSLLIARRDIHGDLRTPYGVSGLNDPVDRKTNYIEDVCEQVIFHEKKMREQQQLIGPERFWIVRYEEFCKGPHELVKKVSEKILKQPIKTEQMETSLKPFASTNKMRLEPEVFFEMERIFARVLPTSVPQEPLAAGPSAILT